MTRRVVVADGHIYTFSPDDEVPLSGRTWAFVNARLVDEITNEPPGSDVTIDAAESGFIPRVASDGLVGLIGIPRRVIPIPAPLCVTIMAEGYIPLQGALCVAPIANFPPTFASHDGGNLFLHRQPTIIRGRTVLASGNTTTPLAGITVSVTGIWRTFPPANLVVPAAQPNLVSLQPALYFPRTAAAGQLRRRDMVQVMGEDKQLLEWVPSGSNLLSLSDRLNIAASDILLVDALNPDSMEYLTIASIVGASTVDQPASITLTHPFAYLHRSNAVVRKVTLQAPAINNQFGLDAIVGDTCVLLASMNNLDLAQTVEITGGTNPPEYHNLSRFSVTSDAAGYFQLPPLSRVAQLEIQANDGGVHPTINRVVGPDYSHRENQIDFTFT